MKINLVAFSVGLLLGLAFSFIYWVFLVSDPPATARKPTTITLQKEVVKKEIVLRKKLDSLKKQAQTLNTDLIKTKASLANAKHKSMSLREDVHKLILHQSSDLPEEINTASNDCDSLITTVEYLMETVSIKDSLQEEVTSNLEYQLSIKDSTIALKDLHYIDIKSAFTKSIDAQEALQRDNKLLNRELKKQKIKSKLLSVGLVTLAGFATGYFITC